MASSSHSIRTHADLLSAAAHVSLQGASPSTARVLVPSGSTNGHSADGGSAVPTSSSSHSHHHRSRSHKSPRRGNRSSSRKRAASAEAPAPEVDAIDADTSLRLSRGASGVVGRSRSDRDRRRSNSGPLVEPLVRKGCRLESGAKETVGGTATPSPRANRPKGEAELEKTEINELRASNGSQGGQTMIKFNVGGKRYITTRSTLFSQGKNFLTMLIENDSGNGVPCVRDEEGYVFIDRNSDSFAVVLDFLRSGQIFENPNCSVEQIRHEFDFYQIPMPSREADLDEDEGSFTRRLSAGWGMSSGCQKLKQSSMAGQWKEQARRWIEDNIRLIEEVMVDYTNQGYIDCKLFSHWNTNPEAYHLHLGTKLTTPLPGAVLGNRIWWMYATRWLQQQYENKLIATYSRQELYLNWAGVLLPNQSHSQFATLSSYGGAHNQQQVHQNALLQDLQHLSNLRPGVNERMAHSFAT